jgi:hypothetical protein
MGVGCRINEMKQKREYREGRMKRDSDKVETNRQSKQHRTHLKLPTAGKSSTLILDW